MDKTEVPCAVCNTFLETIHFNLKSNNSKYSNTPLISIIENVTAKFLPKHFDICIQCYDLLNELDAIELRQMEIRSQFKKYVEHHYKQNISSIPNINPEGNEISINDNLSDCSKTIENSITAKLNKNIKSNVKLVDENTTNSTLSVCNIEETVPVSSTEKTEKIKIGKIKYPGAPKPHKCHCSKEFRTASELKNHMNTHNNRRAFICEICGQSYKHKAAFNIHMDMHNGINPFTCIYCHKSFTQKGALVRHVPIHTGEMPYQCDECGKRFVHHTSFNIHRLSHTGLKSYKCTTCGLALMSGSHLKRHMRIHTGEKNFACGICGKRFAEKYNLAVHEKLHTNPCSSVSQKRNYSCQICGVSFERKVKLDEHLVKEHQIMKLEIDNKDILKQPFICNDWSTDEYK
ncbi:zinc finger protein 37-like [Anoplophora glabripennis]|uniref:zinc finger protein 37-like n=1 Tax=Anoplophora glabripennis TaxID=217634 RepID=UPI00087577D6|nr:zinc finger protein 37-like [Anoplophora glabripennis]